MNKKMRKKIIIYLSVCIVVFIIAGCGDETVPENNPIIQNADVIAVVEDNAVLESTVSLEIETKEDDENYRNYLAMKKFLKNGGIS